MSKASRNVIAIAVVTLFVAIAVIYSILNTHSVIIPDGSVGAYAGNLNNDGLFCEHDGKVYFSNSYDEGAIYSMNPDQTDIRKIYNLKAKYINAAGDYLIFFGDTISESKGLGSVVSKPGIYLMKNNGKELHALTRKIKGSLITYGNTVFYQDMSETEGPILSSYNIRKGTVEEVFGFQVNPNCIENGVMYFNGTTDNHHLFAYSLATGGFSDIWGGEIWNPVVQGDYVYYMDVKNNYRLCRYNISQNEIEILSTDRIDFFNVFNDIIYFQVSSKQSPCLRRINTDGSNNELIAEGIFREINVTSRFVYFKAFGDDYTTYCTPTYGLPSVTEFTLARDAIKSSK